MSESRPDNKSNAGGRKLMRLMSVMLLCGLVLTAAGVYLLLYTPIPDQYGPLGLSMIALMIAIGLFLLIPAKLYLLLKLTGGRNKGSP